MFDFQCQKFITALWHLNGSRRRLNDLSNRRRANMHPSSRNQFSFLTIHQGQFAFPANHRLYMSIGWKWARDKWAILAPITIFNNITHAAPRFGKGVSVCVLGWCELHTTRHFLCVPRQLVCSCMCMIPALRICDNIVFVVLRGEFNFGPAPIDSIIIVRCGFKSRRQSTRRWHFSLTFVIKNQPNRKG